MAAHVLQLRGEIDLNEKTSVTSQLDPLLENQSTPIVVDLSDVTYVDSSGIAIFIDALQRVRQYGGRIGLASLQDNVRMVFEIAKLDQVFQIYPDRDTAVKALSA
jgi:anti-sigma B factor antagonist